MLGGGGDSVRASDVGTVLSRLGGDEKSPGLRMSSGRALEHHCVVPLRGHQDFGMPMA